MPKSFAGSRKSSNFAPAIRESAPDSIMELGYGVMVTLQILVLPFLVRVRVPQPPIRPLSTSLAVLFCFCTRTPSPSRAALRNVKVFIERHILEMFLQKWLEPSLSL